MNNGLSRRQSSWDENDDPVTVVTKQRLPLLPLATGPMATVAIKGVLGDMSLKQRRPNAVFC